MSGSRLNLWKKKPPAVRMSVKLELRATVGQNAIFRVAVS
jgi:hypothetical protein